MVGSLSKNRTVFNSSTTRRQFTFAPVHKEVKTTIIVFCVCITIFGVLANALALSLKVGQLKRKKKTGLQSAFRRSVTSYLVISLSISDILTAIINPTLVILNVLLQEMLGPWLCKINRFLVASSVTITVNNLFCISVEQYLCVFHWQRLPSCSFVKRAIKLVWIEAVLFSLSLFVFISPQSVDLNSYQYTIVCKPDFQPLLNRIAYIFYFLVFYLIPLTFMIYSALSILRFSKKQGAAKLTVLQNHNLKKAQIFTNIIWAFVIPYSPIALYALVSIIFKKEINFETDYIIRYAGSMLAFSNCCANPLIYFLKSSAFRSKIKEILITKWTVIVSLFMNRVHAQPP